MKKITNTRVKNKVLPVIVEKNEDGFYVVSCHLFSGCFSQGKTVDEALKNIKEVITLCLEEKENKALLRTYNSPEVSLHTVAI